MCGCIRWQLKAVIAHQWCVCVHWRSNYVNMSSADDARIKSTLFTGHYSMGFMGPHVVDSAKAF